VQLFLSILSLDNGNKRRLQTILQGSNGRLCLVVATPKYFNAIFSGQCIRGANLQLKKLIPPTSIYRQQRKTPMKPDLVFNFFS
jgi:hypothetical protein